MMAYNLILAVTFLFCVVNSRQVVDYQHQDDLLMNVKSQMNNTNNQTVWDIELSSDIIELQWHGKPEKLEINVIRWPAGVKLVAIEGSIDKTDVAVIEGTKTIRLSCVATNYSSEQVPAYFHEQQNCTNRTVQFSIKPNLIGRAVLNLSVIYYDVISQTKKQILVKSQSIIVYKKKRTVDIIFRTVIYVLVTISTLGMGTRINMEEVKNNLKKPKAPAIALISQFTFMPLLSYTIIYLQGYTGGTALGFFALGCAPGGGASNMYSHLLGGNLSVSVTMTLLSIIISLGTIPLWLYTLGNTLPSDHGGSINIPFVNILQTFALILIPLGAGLAIQYKLPRVAAVIKKMLKVFMLFMVVFIFTFGVYTNLYIFQMFNPSIVFTSACLPYGGFILGGLFAVILRFEWSLIKTIAIETGLQNSSISYLVITSILVSPDLELAVIPVVASSIMSPLPLLIATICYTIYNKCKSRDSKRTNNQAEKVNFLKGDQRTDNLEFEEKLPFEKECDNSQVILDQVSSADSDTNVSQIDEKTQAI